MPPSTEKGVNKLLDTSIFFLRILSSNQQGRCKSERPTNTFCEIEYIAISLYLNKG